MGIDVDLIHDEIAVANYGDSSVRIFRRTDKGICLMVTRGSCFLGVDDQPRVPLVAGDFIFLPAPHSYSLSSSPEMLVQSVCTVISEQEFRRRRLLAKSSRFIESVVRSRRRLLRIASRPFRIGEESLRS